jgi:hypothetical protein
MSLGRAVFAAGASLWRCEIWFRFAKSPPTVFLPAGSSDLGQAHEYLKISVAFIGCGAHKIVECLIGIGFVLPISLRSSSSARRFRV